MPDRPDPLGHAAGEDVDLHGLVTWEPRTLLDRALARYTWLVIRLAVVALALLLFLGELILFGLQIMSNPGSALVVVLFPLSVIPAAILAGYVWYTDIENEPWLLLVGTYVLAVLLATFPTVVNTITRVAIEVFVPQGPVRLLVDVANFYLVVAPGEEAAKLAAVFTYAYWHADFDSVVDGAVYGAVAGLGFATIENVSYIIQVLASTGGPLELIVGGGIITVVRSIAGPGHVIWTAIAGWYLGLAKYNEEYRMAIIAKGLLIAIVLHGTYNTAMTLFGQLGGALGLGIGRLGLTLGFALLFHLAAFAYLFLKLRRYRRAYAEASPGPDPAPVSDLEGYDDDN